MRYEHDILLVASVILIMKDGEHKRMEKWFSYPRSTGLENSLHYSDVTLLFVQQFMWAYYKQSIKYPLLMWLPA